MTKKYPKMEMYDEIIELLFNSMPYVFWKDKTGKYLGGNLNQACNLGFKSPMEFVGKTIFEILSDKKSAKLINETDNKVMDEDITLVEEEKIITPNGEKTYSSQKSPIYNEKGEVIGMLGFAMDVTEIKKQEELVRKERDSLALLSAKKESERLKLENNARKVQLEAQEEFTKMANQVAHDIRSPLASLLMIVKACESIPERERIALRAASTRISDIANNLLYQYRLDKQDVSSESEEKRPILLSATLLQLLTEKKFQYQDSLVEFDCQFNQSGQFAFISIEPSSFKRMISNLINNAVDAFLGKSGVVTLKVEATNEWGHVIVGDNGKGMPPSLIEKITNNISVTEGKVDGNGIGLTQVRETLSRNGGILSIHSTMGKGTEIQLKFPRVNAPLWVAEDITLGREDIVVILDDDHSIHGAWESRFELILKQASQIKLHHFEVGQEALHFLKGLDKDKKKKILLLTDFELLNQALNGLDVVEQSNLSRAILVTSHYDNPDIQKRAQALGAKILPKQLASEIPMIFSEELSVVYPEKGADEFVHAIIVDDDIEFVDNVICYSFDDSDVIVHFTSPEELKDNLTKYPEKYLKDTKICLDNNFDTSSIKGVQLAEELHNMGYTKLYLISGDTFRSGELPTYLTVLSKGDVGIIKDW